MPELPEVETTRRGITPYIKEQTVKEVIIRQYRLRWPVPDDINDKLKGATINNVDRRAKYLLLGTNDGALIIHLGMSGCLRVINNNIPADKHDHVDIIFSNDLMLRYTDPRRFGSILWANGSPWEHRLLKKLGPEPLSDEFCGQHLHVLSRGKSRMVKTFIMDNHVVVGVGNIYASEALFNAGIRPDLLCASLSEERCVKLAMSIKTILNKAIQAGGTTLRDFVGGDGKPGYFQQELAVYGRRKQKCRQCNTPITEIKQGNRSSFYCSQCQR